MAFSLYCGNETTTFYDRTKNFKHVFSERRYSGHLATSRKTVEQGFDKRESLWKRGGGAVEEKEKSFSRKISFSLPRLSAGGEAAPQPVPFTGFWGRIRRIVICFGMLCRNTTNWWERASRACSHYAEFFQWLKRAGRNIQHCSKLSIIICKYYVYSFCVNRP